MPEVAEGGDKFLFLGFLFARAARRAVFLEVFRGEAIGVEGGF